MPTARPKISPVATLPEPCFIAACFRHGAGSGVFDEGQLEFGSSGQLDMILSEGHVGH